MSRHVIAGRLLKNSVGVLRRCSEPVLSLSKERTEELYIIEDFPFMLRPSKHSELFFSIC
jgi:hypothetical protein